VATEHRGKKSCNQRKKGAELGWRGTPRRKLEKKTVQNQNNSGTKKKKKKKRPNIEIVQTGRKGPNTKDWGKGSADEKDAHPQTEHLKLKLGPLGATGAAEGLGTKGEEAISQSSKKKTV